MVIRQPKITDYKILEGIARKHNFPMLFDHVASIKIAEDDGVIVGFGVLRTILESLLYCDVDESKRTIISVTGRLIEEAIKDTKELNYTQLHGFVQDNKFEKILKKHFGFINCNGKALVTNVLD